jgi:hypothetical protein
MLLRMMARGSRGFVVTLVACLAIATGARAQDVAASDAEAAAPDAAVAEVEETAAPEPAPVTTPTSATRRAAPPSPQAYDSELPPLALGPPPEAGVEIMIAINPSLFFAGGLGGLTPSISTTTDLLFALDRRAWLGFGLGLSYVEQRTMAFPGVPEQRFTTTAVTLPLLFQYYFADPSLGAAVPTLRLRVAGAWAETPNSPNPSIQTAGAELALYGGVTWMGVSWLALRILGGISSSFRATVVGPITITANVGIEALVAAVVRL